MVPQCVSKQKNFAIDTHYGTVSHAACWFNAQSLFLFTRIRVESTCVCLNENENNNEKKNQTRPLYL
jgi:hypothetical protein